MGAVSQEGDRERDELRSHTSLVRDRLFPGAAIAFVLKVGGAGLAILLQLVLARALGKELFSTYVVAIAWAGVLVLIGKAGMDSAALRFLPEYGAKGAPGAQSGFRTASRRWVTGASIGTALIGCAVVWLLSSRLGPTTSLTLYAAFASVPILSLLQLHAGFLQAEKRIAASQGPLLCGLPLVAIILVCIVFHVLEGDRNPAVAALLYGSAALVALSVTLFIGRGGRETKEPAVFLDRSTWMNVGASLLLTAGFGLVLAHADILMLGMLGERGDTGEYAVANRLARFLAFPLLAGNAIMAPMISQLHHGGKRAELQRLVRRAATGIALVSAPILLVLVFQGEAILTLFGPGFAEGNASLRVLLLGQCVNVLMGSVGYLLSLTGGHAVAAKVLGGSAALNVVLNAILIPLHGPLGAAIATATTTALWNVSMYVLVRKRLGIRPSFF